MLLNPVSNFNNRNFDFFFFPPPDGFFVCVVFKFNFASTREGLSVPIEGS